MNKNHCKQENIRLGTHGEDYGSWMSNPVFYIIGGIGVLTAVLAVLSFYVLHVAVLGVLFNVITIALLVLLIWITWIRRQYAFGGAESWNRFIESFFLIWTMMGRKRFWKLAAAPEH